MGVKLLLDTHTLLWALMQPDQLSQKARKHIEAPENQLLVSAASAWEITTKHRLGKLKQADALVSAYPQHIQKLGARELAISTAHALLAGGFQAEHRDPFDRMLAAQAMIEGLTLVTKDSAFDQFPIRLLW